MSESPIEHARVMAYPPTPCTYSAYEWRKVVQELLAEIESARLDAERYRWLRENLRPIKFEQWITTRTWKPMSEWSFSADRRFENVDAAIDAAMQEQK